MKCIIAILFILGATELCNAQSIEEDRIYATQFRGDIYLDAQLATSVTKLKSSTIHILESNENNQITRELNRLSDSTFLYTEYLPINSEVYIKGPRGFHISKQGVLVFSNETVIDSSVMWNPETYETFPSPRKRNIYKPTGEWIEKYGRRYNNRIKGSFNDKGKHGEWYHYIPSGELDKIITYENGEFIKEDYRNYLNYESIDKLKDIIQKTWHLNKNVLSTNFNKHSDTYKFDQDGTLTYTFNRYVAGKNVGYTRKGTWLITNFKTVEFTLQNKKRKWNLVYLNDNRIRLKE